MILNYKIRNSSPLLWGHTIALLIALLLGLQYDVETASKFVAGIIVTYGLPAGLCRILLPYHSQRIGWVLLCVGVLLMIGISMNLSTYTAGDWSLENPNVVADAERDINAAHNIFAGVPNPYVATGYPTTIYILYSLFGVNVMWPMMLSMSCIIGTIAVAGAICGTFFSSTNSEKYAFWGMILTSTVAHLILMGTIVMKDAGVTLGMSLFGLALVKYYRRKTDIYGHLSALIGALILMLLKGPMGWFLIAGIVVLAISKRDKSNLISGIYLLVLCAIIILGGQMFRAVDDFATITAVNTTDVQNSMHNLPSLTKYVSLLPDYYSKPLYERILLLPFTAAAQYFPPFPWNFSRDLYFGGFYWWPHISFGWYAIGGMMIGFYCLSFLRKRGDGFNGWALWWGMCYLGIALASGGTVPRYYIPFIPLGIPIALQFISQIRNRIISLRAAKIYLLSYCLLLIFGLIVSYLFLKS